MRGRWIAAAVGAILAAHIIVTAFDNLPDSRVSLGTRFPLLRKIPQWKFFAPNPGIEDLYVMYRTDDKDGWSRWRELVLARKASSFSAFWNPGSRAGKALFDAAHQLRTLAGYGSSFEWATASDSYALIRNVVRARCVEDGDHVRFQFMILASVPQEGADEMKPILVSETENVASDASENFAWT